MVRFLSSTSKPILVLSSRKVTGLKQATIAQLPSHIVKIYEIILRVGMVRFIDSNGFRSGRSCLTQLLSHFDDVLSGMVDGSDVDPIYLGP